MNRKSVSCVWQWPVQGRFGFNKNSSTRRIIFIVHHLYIVYVHIKMYNGIMRGGHNHLINGD